MNNLTKTIVEELKKQQEDPAKKSTGAFILFPSGASIMGIITQSEYDNSNATFKHEIDVDTPELTSPLAHREVLQSVAQAGEYVRNCQICTHFRPNTGNDASGSCSKHSKEIKWNDAKNCPDFLAATSQ